MAVWRYRISLQVMKLDISARSCNILYLNIITDPKLKWLYLFFCLLAVNPWCVKRRAVGFSEVSLRGVMRSAKPITTAYTLVSASTSLGLRIRLQVTQGIKRVLQGTSWVSNYIECWNWLFNEVDVAKRFENRTERALEWTEYHWPKTKKWNRLNFLEAYNHLKWKCFMA